MSAERQLVAEVAAELCLARVGGGHQLGVFVENLPPLDPQTFVSTLAKSPTKLRVALLGGGSRLSVKTPKALTLTTDPTEANRWRNDKTARDGTPGITLVLGAAPKLNSLRSAVTLIGHKDLRRSIVERAIALLDSPERRAFWRAASELHGEFPLSILLNFAAVVEEAGKRSQAALLEREPKLVHLLGLLEDSALFATSGPRAARAAIRRNLDLVKRLRALPASERAQVVAVVEDEDASAPKRKTATAILKYERTGDSADLQGLTRDEVSHLLRPPRRSTDDEALGDERPQSNKRERVDGDVLALDLLLTADGRGLGPAAKRFKTAIEPDEEGGIEPEEISIGRRQLLPRTKVGTTQAAALFARALSADFWGALVSAPEAADFVAALKLVASGDAEVTPFEPEADQHLRWMLQRAVNQGLVGGDVLDRWEGYKRARAALLPHASALTDHPLLALAGTPQLKEKAERLLEGYGAMLAAVSEAADALKRNGSIEPAKRLFANVMCLDVVFVRSARGELSAIAAPTHPFHLWRWAALLDTVGANKGDLAEIGLDQLEPLVADPPAIAPHLVLSPFAVGAAVDRPRPFVATGSFGALPLFSEPTARNLGKFRARSLAKIAARLVRLMPHAAFGLKLLLVDPQSLTGALEDLLDLESVLDEDVTIPLHVTVAQTRIAREATDEEEEQVEGISRELRDAGGTLTVLQGVHALKDVAAAMERNPPHLAVVFDPGEGQELRIGITAPPMLSPLVLPRAYRYDAFDDRLDVIVAGTATPFSQYHDIFCEMLDLPRSDFIGRRSGASRSARELETIARHAVWTVIVDQGLEPTLRIGGAIRLDWRTDGSRDVVTYSAHPETAEELVRDAIRVAGLVADEETVKQMLNKLTELSGEALLALAKPRPTTSLAEPRLAKAYVGVLAAVRWYERAYPDAVLVSLDEPTSRRWVLGQADDDRHGDLLGIRLSPEGVVVEAVEVKAHEDPSGAVRISGGAVEGKAATQVDQTLRTLKAILAPSPASAIARARQDILRDQLYRAVASRPYKADQRMRFVRLLEELFSSGAARFDGLIFQVKIESGVAPVWPSAPAHYRSPAGNPIGIVALTESEARSDRSPRIPPDSSKGKGRSPKKPARAPTAEPPAPTTKETQGSGLKFLIGHTAAKEPVFWEPHKEGNRLNNFGFLVTGDSGAGKTQFLRALVAEIAAQGLPVCVFDFKNDYAVPEFSQSAGLQVYDIDRDGLPFNPLSLVANERGEAQPIRQVHELAGILTRIFDLGPQQESRLKQAMQTAYEQHGLAPSTWHSVAKIESEPSFGEVVAILKEDDKNQALLNRLSPLFDLDLFRDSSRIKTSFEQLLNGRVVLDLHTLPDERIKAAISEFIIVRLHGYLLKGDQPRQLRRLLVLDEAWRVGRSARLQELAREGRAFGVGIAIGTQFPDDIPDTLSGNLATQLLLLNQDTNHRRAVARTLTGTLSGPAATQLLNQIALLQMHEGFLRNQHYAPYVLVRTVPHHERKPTKG